MNPNTPPPDHSDTQADATLASGGGVRPMASEDTDATVVPSVSQTPGLPSAAAADTRADAARFGRYVLIDEIARGGMGVVYRARQHGLDRVVALKMILGVGVDGDTVRRFLLEAQSAAALDHPNVVPVYDSGEIDAKPYFTMAFIDGPNLRSYVDARGVLPIEETARLFTQIVAGVGHAHRHGIIHRDLKPANVLIDKDGRPRVTDFGLAKRSAANTQLTATGQVVGTPAYMAPEQARDSKDVGPPADVYALGAILYFLLTGRPPFEGEGVTDLLIKVVTETPIVPRVFNTAIPSEIEALCLRCLSKSAADRPADATELAATFAVVAEPYLPRGSGSLRHPGPRLPAGLSPADPSHAATKTVPPAAVPHPASTPSRRPLVLGGLAAVGLAGAVVFFLTRDKAAPPVPPATNPPTVADANPVTPPAPDATFPAPTRKDFGLKVDVTAPASRPGPNGSVILVPETPMTVRVRADRDCRVVIWSIDPAGHIMRVFPNEYESDDRLAAGQERTFPPGDRYEIATIPTDGPGTERLRVVAMTGEMMSFPLGVKNGQFTFYTSELDRQKLASAVRGVVVRKKGAGDGNTGDVAEAELLYRVQK